MIIIKKLLFLTFVVVFGFSAQVAYAAKPTSIDNSGVESSWQATSCTTIQDGTLEYPTGRYLGGEPLQTGFDVFGYNYQSHLFKGYYANVYLNGDGLPPYDGNDTNYLAANPTAAGKWYWPYRDIQVVMKWNDAWIANTDCDGNGTLDRHYGFSSYIGSSAWETVHMWESYEEDGATHTKNYFTKIVAAPSDAVKVGALWYNADGSEIGQVIWGEFAVIQDILNDPYSGDNRILYLSPLGPGLGKY